MGDGSYLPIETLSVGDSVQTQNEFLCDDEATPLLKQTVSNDDTLRVYNGYENPIEASTWRSVRLSLVLPQGAQCEITLLRPLAWFQFTAAQVGCTISLQLPEMGIIGSAKVCSIGPCPNIVPLVAGTHTVTGKFVTTNVQAIDLWINELNQAIGTTASHPFWSLDRNSWVPAGDLTPGEHLLTLDAAVTVKAITLRSGAETVYNLEIHRDHTFFVSDAKLWVHNNCDQFPIRMSKMHQEEWIRKRVEKLREQFGQQNDGIFTLPIIKGQIQEVGGDPAKWARLLDELFGS